jgi:Leucine rich repeat/Secretion system C-terminal sorting domain
MNLLFRTSFIIFLFFTLPFRGTTQVVNQQDSLALVDFYRKTTDFVFAGDNVHIDWLNHTNWLTTSPLDTWFGVTVTEGRVTKLNLNGNMAAFGGIPPTIGDLTELTELQLSGCGLWDTIPFFIGNLKELRTLDLSRNYFTGTIPSSFENFTKITTLNLEFNWQMTVGRFPAFLTNLRELTDLKMAYTGLTDSLPANFGNLNKLRYLDLSHNALVGTVPASMGVCYSLGTFHIYGNMLSGHLPPEFTSLSFVTRGIMRFSFYDNRYNFDAFEDLGGRDFLSGNQQHVPITRKQDTLSVTAGGTLALDSFFLYRDSVLFKTQTGDSVFRITNTGNYYVVMRHANFSRFVELKSDTASVKVVLPSSPARVMAAIADTNAVDFNAGLNKLATIRPSQAANGLSGDVAVSVSVDNTVNLFNQQPYVQRHYDIEPTINAAAAEALVTLYFTQEDFDNFNNFVTAHQLALPLLPTGGVDNGNIRIIQRHGAFSGSAEPGNYAGTTVYIAPLVSWNSRDNWWELSFPVTGFSGFFVSTLNAALPLKLMAFNGLATGEKVKLNWKTSNEFNTKDFIIERAQGNNFSAIGKVASAATTGEHIYQFEDFSPAPGDNQYRLKMTDADGRYEYSKVLIIRLPKKTISFKATPNPSSGIINITMYNERSSHYVIRLTDNKGLLVKRITGKVSAGLSNLVLDCTGYPAGIYFISLDNDNAAVSTLKIMKQ